MQKTTQKDKIKKNTHYNDTFNASLITLSLRVREKIYEYMENYSSKPSVIILHSIHTETTKGIERLMGYPVYYSEKADKVDTIEVF